MESLFPQLFFLSFFVPTALRFGAAIAFALMAQSLYQKRAEIHAMRFPIIGTPPMWLVWGKIAGAALVALLFALGLWTQGVALVGVLASLKAWHFSKRYPTLLPESRLAYFLLALICLSLVVTGAGAYAIDKPY